MSNKLKDVFSKKMFEMGLNLQFRDFESKAEFEKAMESVFEEGRPIEITGVSAINTSIKAGDMVYPHTIDGSIEKVVLYPYNERIKKELDTEYGKRTIYFRKGQTKSEIFIETGEDKAIFLRLAFAKKGHTANFTYRMQFNKATQIKSIAEDLCTAISIINSWFKGGRHLAESKDKNGLESIRKSFQKTFSFFDKLAAIEQELQLSFDPAQIDSIDNHVIEVEELYLLLVRKIPIRLNAKLTSIESTGITLEQPLQDLKIGAQIAINYSDKSVYSLFGQSISVYTANFLFNAVVQEILTENNDATKILYGDVDSRPMYISYTGFKTEKEAEIERQAILEKSEIYKNAITVSEHLKDDFSSIDK